MGYLGNFGKQPREILDFDLDYSPLLQGRVDTINTVSCIVEPTGLVINSTSLNLNKAKIVVSGGNDGVTYKVTVLSTSTAGLLYEDEVNVIVKDT